MIGGVDLSTKALHLAVIPYTGREAWFRTEPIERLDASAGRVREAFRAMRELTAGAGLTSVCVERPSGFGWYALLPIFGAVIAGTHSDATVAWLTSSEWRRALNLPMKKDPAQAMLQQTYPEHAGRSEHELDALGIALAWRTILWKADANTGGAA